MATVIGHIMARDAKEAERIANALLKERLVACANIVPHIKSRYWWKGKLEGEKEALLLVKTRDKLIERVIKRVKGLHSYELPAIEFIEVKRENKEYSEWVERETK